MRWPFGLLMIAATGCAGADAPCADGGAGTVCRVAGIGESAFNGDGLAAERTSFYLPSQVRRGPDGLLYVMDFNNMRLRRIEADGTVSTVAGAGIHELALIGLPANQTSLENPIDFEFLADGRILMVSSHDPRVLVIDHDGTLQVFAGDRLPGTIGNEGDGGPALAARFVELAGIAVDPDGAVYVADRGANRVRVIRDGIVTTFAGTGVPGFGGDGGTAARAQLDEPSALVIDAAGTVFISDTGNCAIRTVSPSGAISTLAGVAYEGYSGDGGPAGSAALAHPQGLAVAADGTVFISDRYNSRIRRVGTDGMISTIAGTGTKGLEGDGGPALEAEFGYLGAIQLDDDGGLLVADQTNSVIRKIVGPL